MVNKLSNNPVRRKMEILVKLYDLSMSEQEAKKIISGFLMNTYNRSEKEAIQETEKLIESLKKIREAA